MITGKFLVRIAFQAEGFEAYVVVDRLDGIEGLVVVVVGWDFEKGLERRGDGALALS